MSGEDAASKSGDVLTRPVTADQYNLVTVAYYVRCAPS